MVNILNTLVYRPKNAAVSRRLIPCISIAIFVLIFLPVQKCWAQGGCRGISVVVSTGTGVDMEQALIDARRMAVHQACGFWLDSKAIIEQERMVVHSVVEHTNGFVRNYDVLDKKGSGAEYYVTIRAVVSGDIGDEASKRYFRKLAVVVSIKDGAFPGGEDSLSSSDWLYSELKKEDYNVVIPGAVNKAFGAALASAGGRAKYSVIQDAACRFLARLVITGEMSSRFTGETHIQSYKEFGTLTQYWAVPELSASLIDAESGKVLLAFSAAPTRYVGTTRLDAELRARAGALQEFKKALLDKLREFSGRQERKVALTADNLRSDSDYAKLKHLLEITRWVMISRVGGRSGASAAEFVVTYPEQVYILAETLDSSGFVKITRFEDDHIWLRWLHNN